MSTLAAEFYKQQASDAEAELEDAREGLMQQIGQLREDLKIANEAIGKLTPIQYWLLRLIENCSEVQRVVTNGLCWGLGDRMEFSAKRINHDQLVTKLTVFYATLELLAESGLDLEGLCTADAIREERQRLMQSMEGSRARGVVE